MKTKKIRKLLPVTLTEIEKADVAARLANETQAHQAALDRKKEVTAQLTADIEEHRAAVQSLGSLYASGYEYRQVECEAMVDAAAGWIRVTRRDTGEVVEDRAMREDEGQGALDV